MSMTGKLWAPSEWAERVGTRAYVDLSLDGAQGIGSAEEVMGKEWASLPGPLAVPW